MKIKKVFSFILKGIFWIASAIYVLTHVSSTIAYEWTLEILEVITGISANDYLTEGDEEALIDVEVSVFDKFFGNVFFGLFILFSFIFSILGSILLTRKKSAYASIGLFVAFVLPKEEIFWGTVIDRQTNKIVPFAVIRIVEVGANGETKFIKQTVADVDARYSIYLEELKPTYRLQVESSGYQTHLIEIKDFEKKEKLIDINQDIYLDKEQKPSVKGKLSYLRPLLYKSLMWIIYINSIFFCLFFVFYIIGYPESVYGYVTTALFGYSAIRNTFTIRKRFFKGVGKVIDKKTKKPAGGILVAAFDEGRQLEAVTSDKNGVVKFNLPEEMYDMKVGDKFYKIKLGKSGYPNKNIYVEDIKPTTTQSATASPFGK